MLAPLLMIGAALGLGLAQLAHLPGDTQALWALLGMGAMLFRFAGVPLAAIMFSLELTHAATALLPPRARMYSVVSSDFAAYAAVDLDRETKPPRLISCRASMA